MATHICIFCSDVEHGNLDSAKDIICGMCVLRLSLADKEDLKRAHKKAVERNARGQALALESFIREEIKDAEQTRPKTGKLSDRKGTPRVLRIKKRAGGKSKKQ